MIFFDPDLEFDLSDFGIAIPIIKRGKIISKSIQVESLRLEMPSQKVLELVHTKAYVDEYFSSTDALLRIFELVDSKGNFHRYNPQNSKINLNILQEKLAKRVSGAITCVQRALAHSSRFSFYLGGGMHHAYADQGRGFCPFNDVVIAAKFIQKNNSSIKKIWIVDTDAHKGDGTAHLTQKDDSIITLSIHMAHSWPLDNPDKTDICFTPSNLDIPIHKGQENIYNTKLLEGLISLEKSYGLPDLVLVVAGTDVYEKDTLASTQALQLTLEQTVARDLLVYDFFQERHIPQAWLLGGGYGEHTCEPTIQFLQSIRDSHKQ